MYHLRPAGPEDRTFLFELHRATMREYVDRTWGWDDEVQSRMFAERFDPDRLEVIAVGGVDVGALTVERREDCFFLADIKVVPGYQRRGIGTRVVRDLLLEAHAAGVPVRLRVLKVNPARLLYERLGFIATGESATHVLMETSSHHR